MVDTDTYCQYHIRFCGIWYDLYSIMLILVLPIFLSFHRYIGYCRYNTLDVTDFGYHKPSADAVTDSEILKLGFNSFLQHICLQKFCSNGTSKRFWTYSVKPRRCFWMLLCSSFTWYRLIQTPDSVSWWFARKATITVILGTWSDKLKGLTVSLDQQSGHLLWANQILWTWAFAFIHITGS